MIHTSYYLRPLLDTLYFASTHGRFDKSKVQEKSLLVHQNPNPFSGLYKPDLNSLYLYCSCSLCCELRTSNMRPVPRNCSAAAGSSPCHQPHDLYSSRLISMTICFNRKYFSYGGCSENLQCSLQGRCEGCSFLTFTCWEMETSVPGAAPYPIQLDLG